MNLFHSTSELIIFTILAIVFAVVIAVTILMLYSPAFVQAHPEMAKRMFQGKSTKIGRMLVLAGCAVYLQMNQYLMLETLIIAIIGYHIVMLAFFRNKGVVTLSNRKL